VTYLHHALSFAGISKAGNDLRAFRWGADADRTDVTYLHHTFSFANHIGESGRMSKT
jgi:hypothetical protein